MVLGIQHRVRDALAGLPGRSLGDLLRLSSGVSVRSYGPDGSLQSVSFRGLGPEYTTVMLNGIRLNDEQNGVVDFSRLTLRDVERVTIARGGFSALYGANALGGVVDIATGGISPLSLTVGGGSYGWWSARTAVPIRIGSTVMSTSAAYEHADNGYSFATPEGATERAVTRQNSDYSRFHFSCDGDVRISGSPVSLYADVTSSDLGVPGAFAGGTQGRARENTLSAAVIGSIRTPVGSGTPRSRPSRSSPTASRSRAPRSRTSAASTAARS